MSLHSQVLTREADNPPVGLNGDLRRHRRVPLELDGRFMRENRDEHDCYLRDISIGGACVLTEAEVAIGEHIIAYFNDLGGLEGKVTRLLPGGYAFQFSVSDRKREKLAAQIMWLLNRPEFPEELGRQHSRTQTKGHRTTIRFDDGMLIDAELIDLSASGASIRTRARPAIGEEIVLGKVRAVVRRHHAEGIGVQFYTILDQAALKSNFP